MTKRKRKFKSRLNKEIEFIAPFSLEESSSRLNDLTNQPLYPLGKIGKVQLSQGNSKLKVESSPVNDEIVEFRVWVWPNAPDVEISGHLEYLSQYETLVTGEVKAGFFSYYWVFAPLLWVITSLAIYSVPLFQAIVLLSLATLIFGLIWLNLINKSRDKLIRIVETKLTGKRQTDDKLVTIKRKND